MKVRVIAGRYGGRWLDAPDNRRTHPMGERVRNALFNSLGDAVQDARVLDAFAGTGAVGLEALSRGARQAVFVERDRLAFTILCKNIAALGADSSATAIKAGVGPWLGTYHDRAFDIIFADPPYHDLQLAAVSRLFTLLKSGGFMVLSHTGIGEGPKLANDIVVVDNRSYGNAHLTFFRRADGRS